MKKIVIYENSNGQLTLKQFSQDSQIKELKVEGKDVFYYLKRVSDDTIEDLRIGKKDNKTSARVITNKHKIDLIDIKKLDKHEPYLTPLTDKLEKDLTDEKMKEIMQNRKKKTTPTVKRENKYSNKSIKIGKLLAGVALVGLIAGGCTVVNNINEKHTLDDIPDFGTEHDSGIIIDEETNVNDDIIITLPNIDKKKQVDDSPTKESTYAGDIVELDYEDQSNTDKARYTRETYGDLITKYSKRYGVDPNIMLAIATQERGVHSREMDSGGATGLMQIQNSVWLGKEISAYNYETGERDTFAVTQDMIKNLETNVMMGCMYFQECLGHFDNNILLATQCYNMGSGNVNIAVDAYAASKGITRQDVLKNQTDTGWMGYLDMISVGDKDYVTNVYSWLGNDKVISTMNNDEIVSLQIANHSPIKTF